jgi:hypothetical protein
MLALFIAIVLGVPGSAYSVPFCSALDGRVAPVVIVQARDNDAIARIFPVLIDYRSSMKDLNLGRASIDIYRLKRIQAQLQADQVSLQMSLKTMPPLRADAAQTESKVQVRNRLLQERELLEQMHVGLSSVLANQQGIARALDTFINEEESAEDATNGRVAMAATKAANTAAAAADAQGSDSAGRLMQAAANAQSTGNLNDIVYARPMVANSQAIVDQESYLHNLMALGVEHCYARRQSVKPAPTSHP